MLFKAVVTLSLACAWGQEEPLSCTGEASLLQKQRNMSRLVLDATDSLLTYESVPEEILEKMIVSDPWRCDMIPTYDSRRPTCGLSLAEAGLHPAHTSELGNNSHDHKNSMRMLFPVGALPCCGTMPFCAAPACAPGDNIASADLEAEGAQKCTKHEAQENVDFMKSPSAWPVYHGWGGSFELDVLKHWDVLRTTLLRDDPEAKYPFDLVIDVGANSGYITEKLTARHFAKNYILVEAYEGMKRFFETRLGEVEWRQKWFTEQVPKLGGREIQPEFEFLSVAVQDHSEGYLDLCTQNMWSKMNKDVPCPVDRVALDDVIPSRLSPNFEHLFSQAQEAYIKIDVEGMDEMALRGMPKLLQEQRGSYSNGEPRFLVNFMMMEFCPILMQNVHDRDGLEHDYDLKSMIAFLESMGFESFIMGPRYLPLSHGSWDDNFNDLPKDVENSVGGLNYPAFLAMTCPGAECPTRESKSNRFVADIFAVRATHPKATQIKLALGSCLESHDFDLGDPQYSTAQRSK